MSQSPLVVTGLVARNDEDTIAKVILQARQFSNEVVVVDDGSTDLTPKIADGFGCKVIRHPKTLGDELSLRSLFLAEARSDLSVLVTLRADGKYNAQEVLRLIQPVVNGECDIAFGSRTQDAPTLQQNGSSIPMSNGNLVKDSGTLYRAYSKEALYAIVPLNDHGSSINGAITELAKSSGVRVSEFETSSVYTPTEPKETSTTTKPSDPGLLSKAYGIVLNRPLMVYGIPAAIFLLVAISQGFYTIYVMRTQHYTPDFGLMFFYFPLILAVILGSASLLVQSISKRI